MAEKRRGLGRGLGALIPNGPSGADRPVDVFFPGQKDAPPTEEPLARTDAPAADGPDAATATPRDGRAVGTVVVATTTERTAGETGEGLVPVPGAHFAEIP